MQHWACCEHKHDQTTLHKPGYMQPTRHNFLSLCTWDVHHDRSGGSCLETIVCDTNQACTVSHTLLAVTGPNDIPNKDLGSLDSQFVARFIEGQTALYFYDPSFSLLAWCMCINYFSCSLLSVI